MINLKSQPREILHYISQINSLALSEKEKLMMSKIMGLRSIVDDNEIRNLIENDLKDCNWVIETKQLIDLCNKRKEKTKLISEHISDCYTFLIYRVLELKFNQNADPLIYYKLAQSLKDTDGKEFKNKYMIDYFSKSKFHQFLAKSNTNTSVTFDLKFLQVNRTKLFSNNLFKAIV